MSSKVQIAESNRAYPSSSFVYTPLRHVRVLFISFLQGLFGQAPHGSFRWDEDEVATEIIIRDENPIQVETLQKRPAINLTMGAVQFYSLGIDDLVSYDFDTARKVKGVLVPGVVSINCLSRVDLEAHDLAWTVSEHIWLLRELFMKMGFFELGRGIQIAPPSSPGTIVAGDMGDEWYNSSVSVPFQFQRKSAFTPLGKRIVQSICTRLSTISRRVESMGYPAPSHEYQWSRTAEFPPAFAPDASDARGETPDPAGTREVFLPRQPHPLNPARTVKVKTVFPNRPGLKSSLRPRRSTK